MFDLDAALRQWRTTARNHSLSEAELDELEDHLYSAYVAHREHGASPAAALATALRTLGPVKPVSSEFQKVRSMKWHRVLQASWAAFAVAFLLPVANGGITLLDVDVGEGLLPGFQAIRVALEEGGWCTLSALTNLCMLATMWRVSALSKKPLAVLAVTMLGAALLNGWWLVEFDYVSDLRVGYYAWWGSFGLAATGLLIRARALWQGSIRALTA